jgi:hypothetical protein
VSIQDNKTIESIDLPKNPFEDTDDENVLTAYALEIVNGKTESSFDPNGAIQRQEAAAMLLRAAKVFKMSAFTKAPYFLDASKISDYARQSIDFVYSIGVMKGTGNSLFDPAGSYTREQAYMTVLRLYNAINGIENDQTPATELEVRKTNISTYGEVLFSLNGFLYYKDEKGNVYRVSLGSTEKAELVLKQMDGNVYSGDGYSFLFPSVFNDIVIINERVGGASMGSSYSTVFLPDSRTEKFDYAVSAYAILDGYDVVLGYGQGVGVWSFFEVRVKGESEFQVLGEDGFSYGVYVITDETVTSNGSCPDFAIMGNEVYVIAQFHENETLTSPGVYKVDVKTGKTERVTDGEAIHFRVYGDTIYYTGKDKLLYQIKNGEVESQRISDIMVDDFFILGNEIYYQALEGSLRRLSDNKIILDNSNIGDNVSDTEGYCVTMPYIPETNSFQGSVIDKKGNVYKSDPKDDIKYITVYDGVIWEFT